MWSNFLGWSDFSAKTEENEEKLFGLVKNMTSRLQSTDDKKGEKLFLQMIISRRRQNLPGATTEEKGDEEFLWSARLEKTRRDVRLYWQGEVENE